jgi:lysophospholipase L1-like esterase
MASTEKVKSASNRAAPGRRALRAVVFVMWCALAVELLLWAASRISPRVDLLLTNRQAVPKTLPDEELGKVRNPEFFENDSRGFRNEKALDSAEIVTLGDSQTVGVNARLEDAWPKQLQRMLATPVYNMAVGATGPGRYRYLVDQALELEPRWVLTGFYVGNDLWNSLHEYYILNVPGMEWRPKDPANVRAIEARAKVVNEEFMDAARYLTYEPPAGAKQGGARGGRERGPALSPVRLLQDHSRIWGAARAIKGGIRDRSRSGERFDRRHWEQLVQAARSDPGLVVYESSRVKTILHPGHRFLGENIERDSILQEGLDLSLQTLRQIDHEVKAGGARHMVVLIPSKEFVYAEALDPAPGAGSVMAALARNEVEIWNQTKTFLSTNGIDFVDALPEMRRGVADGARLYPYSTQSHPDTPGYERIARAVARALDERGFAARRP